MPLERAVLVPRPAAFHAPGTGIDVRPHPHIGLATSSIVKAVTGSGVIRGVVNYEVLERALRAQVKDIPKRVSQHVLMAIAAAIAGARVPGAQGVARTPERDIECQNGAGPERTTAKAHGRRAT